MTAIVIYFLLLALAAQSHFAESVLPALAYSHTCSSTMELRNLGQREVDAEVEPHRESGSLVALTDQNGLRFHLMPGEQRRFTLQLPEETGNAWAIVRELRPDRGSSPVLAVSAGTSCISGSKVQNALREVAHPAVNPWFDGDVDRLQGARLVIVNTSEISATVTGCYSGATLVSNPNVPGGATLTALCSHRFREQLPPFSARQYPVGLEGNSHFSLHAAGRGIALQMLRLLDAGTQLYQVDSSISFGK